LIEFGIVKGLNEMDPSTVYVVFKCGDEWDLYKNYTGQNVRLSDLNPGWSGVITDDKGNLVFL